MADVAGTNVWPELDKRTAGVAQQALWQRMSTDAKTWITTSSSAATHWSVASTGSLVGLQPYPGTSSRMMLKGSHSALIQIAQDDMDTSFFYHGLWLENDGSSNAQFALTSTGTQFYFGASTSGVELSTAASTAAGMGIEMPISKNYIRVWGAE